MDNVYYVENCQEAVSVRGTKYLSFVLNNGEVKVNGNAFGIKAEASVYLHRVIMCNLKKSGEFVNVENIVILGGLEALPNEHPILKLNLKSNITPEQACEYLKNLASKYMTEPYIKLLHYMQIESLFKLYYKFPAGLSIHHNIEGGLLQHVIEILKLYEGLIQSPQVKNLNHNYVILAVCFHDWGKCMEYDNKKWAVTEDYSLLGHIYMSARAVEELIDSFNEENGNLISEVDKKCIIHCILAHHGQLEWGSPVVPCIPEAYMVHMCDNMSARLYQFSHANHMEKDRYLNNAVVIKPEMLKSEEIKSV